MFDFLKKKKRFELDDIGSDLPKEEEPFKPAFEPAESPFPKERPLPSERPAPLQSPASSDRDMDLVLTKLELLGRRLEVLEQKIDEIYDIAKQSR